MNFRSMGSDGKDGRPLAGLVRQSSVYSLTFDELQSALGGPGKEFGSMNLDELLRSIWTTEEAQAMASAAGGMVLPPEASAGAEHGGLQRQGSLTLLRTLSSKTVDEVWRDLFREGNEGGNAGGGEWAAGGGSGAKLQPQYRQPTLGEITLEEFLVRAGVVREDAPNQPINNNSNANHTSSSMLYGDFSGANTETNAGLSLGFSSASRNSGGAQVPQAVAEKSGMNVHVSEARSSYNPPMQLGNKSQLRNQQGVAKGGIVGLGDPGASSGIVPGAVGFGASSIRVSASGSPASNDDLSPLSPVPYAFNKGPGRKGHAIEKAVERRQKRMIKNRESAARSRARKQAYTMELEAEVSKLKEQNLDLQKKQQELLEVQKNQVLEVINQQHGSKKQRLTRCLTGPWCCSSFRQITSPCGGA